MGLRLQKLGDDVMGNARVLKHTFGWLYRNVVKQAKYWLLVKKQRFEEKQLVIGQNRSGIDQAGNGRTGVFRK